MKSILKFRKISILGCSGSGKSTLAQKLGELLNLPVHHIDCYFWKPNWEKADKKQLELKIKNITKERRWIIDGTYRTTLKNRFKKSDLIILLNLSKEVCIESVKSRRTQPKVGLPEYLEETEEGFNELLSYIENFAEDTLQKNIRPLLERYNKKVVEFNNREKVNEFIEEVKKYRNRKF